MKLRKQKNYSHMLNCPAYKEKQIKLNKFTIKQLKEFCKDSKLKRSGRKIDIVDRLCVHELQSEAVVSIQKRIRGYIVRKYYSYKGIGKTLVNHEDFLSFDNWDIISYHQRFVYTDEKEFSYAFDVVSLCTLFAKQPKYERRVKDVLNPYTRMPFPKDLKKKLYKMIRFGKLLNYSIQTTYHEEEPEKKPLSRKSRVSNIFMEIDRLGNYTDTTWFSSLSKSRLVRFLHELHDIWSYRAMLSVEIKRQIVHPHGNPFRGFNMNTLRNNDFNKMRDMSIDVMETIIQKSINDEFRSLGVMYILTALTLVSKEAADALPWLYESAIHA